MAERVAVIGAGLMGSGIAQVAAAASYQVTLQDVSREALERAVSGISSSYEKFDGEGADVMITENVFESRFMFIDELVRLDADIRTDGHHAVVRGRESLSGAPVRATDIRAGAGLVLAGLVAEGVTTVSEVQHIDRGYQDFVGQLRSLGADVRREPDPVRPEV